MGKYEEALARARQGKPIDEVFPELKKSEDERIRKALVKEFKEKVQKSFVWKGIPNNAILNWLEKQKEQKPFTPKFRVGDVMRTKQEAAEGITDGLPVIVSVDDIYYHCTNELISISVQEEYEFPPMNRRQEERVADSSKTSAGWSMDDLKMIGIAISFIEQNTSCNYILGVNKLDVIAWLKALRSGTIHKGNPHWKPSEEQMIALYKAAQESPIIKENGNYLYDLYDDLRKLM